MRFYPFSSILHHPQRNRNQIPNFLIRLPFCSLRFVTRYLPQGAERFSRCNPIAFVVCYDVTKVERVVRQMSRIYTLAELKNTLNPVFEQFGVKKAVLFGSYAKGLATPRSDVDLYVDSGLRGLAFFGLLDGIALRA